MMRDALAPYAIHEIQLHYRKGQVELTGTTVELLQSMVDLLRLVRNLRLIRQAEKIDGISHRHTVFRLSIRQLGSRQQSLEIGVLNLVDVSLERIRYSKNIVNIMNREQKPFFDLTSAMHAQLTEKFNKMHADSANVNKSLNTLARVMHIIRVQRSAGIAAKDMSIPYKDSKLTRILQDCLGGDAHSIVLAHLDPSASKAVESKEILNFSSATCI